MKKFFIYILLAVNLLTLTAESKTYTNGGKVLNIYVWNDEFSTRLKHCYGSKLPADVKINFIETPSNEYKEKLNQALQNQDKAAPDDKIDIFLVEPYYAQKYLDSPYTLDMKNDVGLTDEDLSNQFKYTQDLATDSNGNLKALTWQCCPGGFIYRRSFAKKVFGSDDPEIVQTYLSDWEKFNKAAAKMKKAGYFMLSGYDDAYRAFSDNVTSPWVVDGKINIDSNLQAWIDQTKLFTKKGYNNKTTVWTSAFIQGMMQDSKVFGYFVPQWLYDYCMPHGSSSASGDWAICKGPASFSWGGTWICAASGTDNIDLIKDIFYSLTCDTTAMTKLSSELGDFVNNKPAMEKIAAMRFGDEFFKGQNAVPVLIQSADSITNGYITKYDYDLNELLQSSMIDYFENKVTEEEALENFYSAALEKFPELQK